jgi:hypothetical protein
MAQNLPRLSVLALLATAACGGIPKQKFVFDAIDVGERPLPCLVVVNDDWVGAAERQQYGNVAGDDELSLTLEFTSAEVEVTMAPMMASGGQPVSVPKSRKEARETSGFMDDTRRLFVTDPQRVLFILPRRSIN